MTTMISITALRKARDQAAAEPLAALGRKRKKLEETGRPALARVLAFLEEKVFEEGVEATAAASIVGSTTASVSLRIETHTGYSLDDLIARVRFETAVHMKAVDPELTIETLSEVLGLSEWRLRRLFEKWPDEAPPRKRRGQREFDPRRGASCDLAARGKLAVAEVEKVLMHLRSVCPVAFADAAPVDAPAAAFAGAASAPSLGDADRPISRRALRRRAGLGGGSLTPAPQRTRSSTSWSGSRGKQAAVSPKGVWIAELAVSSVEVSAALLGELAQQLKAECQAAGPPTQLSVDIVYRLAIAWPARQTRMCMGMEDG